MELTEREKELILTALNLMVKHAANSLQAANEVLPLAAKISENKRNSERYIKTETE